jgi:hypothetical protein
MLPPTAVYRHGTADLSDSEKQAIFRYFDLSNEQLRLIKEAVAEPPAAALLITLHRGPGSIPNNLADALRRLRKSNVLNLG